MSENANEGRPVRVIPAGIERSVDRTRVRRTSLALFGCGLVYALYRGYYGMGGTLGMIGTPAPESDWRAQNLGAAGVLLVVALLPLASPSLSRHPRRRRWLLMVAWALAVGGVMHALIMDAQRVASLAGWHRIRYPESEWLSRDDRAADLQDLLFNETWFLVEGILWAILARTILGRSRGAARWTAGAAAGVAALTCVGLLSAFGVVGGWIVG